MIEFAGSAAYTRPRRNAYELARGGRYLYFCLLGLALMPLLAGIGAYAFACGDWRLCLCLRGLALMPLLTGIDSFICENIICKFLSV